MSAEKLVDYSTPYNVQLVGSVRPDVSWQAQQPEAYDITRFQIDLLAEQVTCPQGKTSRYWKPQIGVHDNPVIEVNFRQKDCKSCPACTLCTRSKSGHGF